MSNEHITDERAAFVSWSQREYRHATIYTNRDFEIGLEAWEARAALHTAAQPVAVPDRVPMTDEQIDKLKWGPHEGNPVTFAEGLRDFARAIEAHHGITTPKADK